MLELAALSDADGVDVAAEVSAFGGMEAGGVFVAGAGAGAGVATGFADDGVVAFSGAGAGAVSSMGASGFSIFFGICGSTWTPYFSSIEWAQSLKCPIKCTTRSRYAGTRCTRLPVCVQI